MYESEYIRVYLVCLYQQKEICICIYIYIYIHVSLAVPKARRPFLHRGPSVAADLRSITLNRILIITINRIAIITINRIAIITKIPDFGGFDWMRGSPSDYAGRSLFGRDRSLSPCDRCSEAEALSALCQPLGLLEEPRGSL